MKTVVLDKYVDNNGNKVIEIDSFAEYVIDAIKEGIQLVKHMNAKFGNIELSGQKLVLYAEDDYKVVYDKYLKYWKV